ncbi:RICIN domain-containing protein [Kitasatospora sp. NPDC089913]|uniref:RICIN domain-containing protein n=1 Tax=Kitasatospora sp. NPDC089913 TaxID=3364080 RepID=UPI00382A71A3
MRSSRQSTARSTARSVVVAGSVLAAATVLAAPAQAAPVLHGYANVAAGKCLDIRGNSTADGALLQEFDCKNASNQRFWTDTDSADGYTEIRVQRSGLCLEPTGAHPGSIVLQRACTGAAGQRWEIVPKGPGAVVLRHPATGQCLNDYASGVGSERTANMWTCLDNAWQTWAVR